MRPAVVVEGMINEYVWQLEDLQRTDNYGDMCVGGKTILIPRYSVTVATEF